MSIAIELGGDTALVTGSSQGIGAAIGADCTPRVPGWRSITRIWATAAPAPTPMRSPPN